MNKILYVLIGLCFIVILWSAHQFDEKMNRIDRNVQKLCIDSCQSVKLKQ